MDKRQELEGQLTRLVARGRGHTRFLDLAERARAERFLGARRDIVFRAEGGYEDCERVVIIVGPQEEAEGRGEEKPFAVLRVRWDARHESLAHRDLLGALMAPEVGLERDCFGDIVLDAQAGTAYVMALREICDFVMNQCVSAGRAVLSWALAEDDALPAPPVGRIMKGTVASPRLDAVLDIGFGLSRSGAAEAVRAGLVKVNAEECLKPDRTIQEGDRVSFRGKGRICLRQLGPRSAKGRLFVEVERWG